MIQSQTLFRVSDNSGAKKVKCIKVLGGFRRKYANLGDLIIVSIRHVKQHKKKIKVKEGEVARAVIIRSKSIMKRRNFSHYFLNENAVVLLTKKNKPIATRVIGCLPKELRFSKFMKVASLASGLI